MALIQVDPKQTKTVVVLLFALVLAMGLAVVRFRAAQQPPAPVNAVAAKATVTEVAQVEDVPFTPVRNPFEKPALVRAAERRAKVLPVTQGLRLPGGVGEHMKLWNEGNEEHIQPLDIGPAPKQPEPVEVEKPDVSKPVFALLATIKGPNGLSAVIRTGESDVRVVEIGDRLADGYRVKALEESRAVLSDGRDTIVAKRPQS